MYCSKLAFLNFQSKYEFSDDKRKKLISIVEWRNKIQKIKSVISAKLLQEPNQVCVSVKRHPFG